MANRSGEARIVHNADSPFAAMSSVDIMGERGSAMIRSAGEVMPTFPRYDSRYARRYARQILASAGYFAELDREVRADGSRADAGLSLAFARSLEYIIRKPYEAEFPELRAMEFIPVMTEIPPEAASFTYRMLTKMGVAKIIQENGADAPKVDLKGEEWQQPIVTIGASYDYTILDTMRAAKMNIPLEAYKAEAARFACEYLQENLAAVGNSTAGLVGLSNAVGITALTQQSTGGNWIAQVLSIGTASTTNATPPAVVVAQGIAGDMLYAIQQNFLNTEGIHRSDTCLTTVGAYGALMSAPRSPGFTDDTLLDYLEKVTLLDIECWPQLNSAGGTTTAAGTPSKNYKGRTIVYKKDPKLLNLVCPMPFTQLPPQPTKMAWEVTCYLRTGAVQVRFPLTVGYMDAVS